MWLFDTSIRQPVLVTMLLAATVIVGGISYSRMPVNLFPDVTFPIVAVSTSFPGASPKEVDTLVTEPIEDGLSSVNNVNELRSFSSEGTSIIVVEFDLEHSVEEGANAVREQLATVKGQLPDDAGDPLVLRFDPSAEPILVYAISSGVPARALRRFIDDTIKPRIERLSDVGQVRVIGGEERQIRVELILNALQGRNLSAQEVVTALREQNLSLPGGRVAEGTQELLLKTTGEFERAEDISQVVVARRNGVPVYLRDIANIADTTKERRLYNRLNGENNVILTVLKQSGTNTVSVADLVKRELGRIRAEFPALQIKQVRDESEEIRESNEDVTLALVMGCIFASLVVLLFFRDLRNTLVTVAGLPVIILGTFWVISFLGFSINIMTLLALSLSIGLLIDDAIVVRENIFRHMERGEEPKIAAAVGTREVAFAVVATTLTVLAVFVPVAFTSGVVGQFFLQFGIIVAVAAVISTIEAFTLAPMLSAYFFKRLDPADQEKAGRESALVGAYGWVYHRYGNLLRWAFGSA